jgi:hypothetical protein
MFLKWHPLTSFLLYNDLMLLFLLTGSPRRDAHKYLFQNVYESWLYVAFFDAMNYDELLQLL